MTEYTGAADGVEDEEENPTPHTEVEDVSLPKKKPEQPDVAAQAVGSLKSIMQQAISGQK
ncbi:MAG TPA: hypothetical protein VGE18_01635 [Candidatus Paceibacterota bacterium]